MHPVEGSSLLCRFQRALTMLEERTPITGPIMIQVEVRSRTTKGGNSFDDIWSVLEKYIPRDTELHFRNIHLLKLFLLCLFCLPYRDLFLLLRLRGWHTLPALKLVEKAPKSTELIDTILEVRSEHRNVAFALVTLDLLIDKMTGLQEVVLLFFIFHTFIMAAGFGTCKLFGRQSLLRFAVLVVLDAQTKWVSQGLPRGFYEWSVWFSSISSAATDSLAFLRSE